MRPRRINHSANCAMGSPSPVPPGLDQGCSGVGTRGNGAHPLFSTGRMRPPLPPLFWTEICAKVSPLLQRVTYVTCMSVRVCRPKLFKNLCLSLVSGVPPTSFLGLHPWSQYGNVKPIWILLKQETASGSGISWAVCKSAPRSKQITMPAPHHSFVYRPDALPAAQPTVSKH